MGAVLLNEMNAYVATLLRAAERTGRVLLLAWNVWSVVRVASYVLIGAAAAAPLLRLAGVRAEMQAARVLAAYGAIGLLVDLALKLALSRPCGRLIAAAIDLDAAKANRPTERPLGLHLE
jgi:drug/metabolite transporter superfamily protein YnfA